MTTVLLLSVSWIIYGILGLFGIQNIPEKYRGSDFERKYKQYKGIAYLLLGIPMFIFWIIVHNIEISNKMPYMITIVVISMPAVIYDFIGERKYKKIIK